MMCSNKSPAQRREIDQVCDRFESAWKATETGGPRPVIEEYYNVAPDSHELLRELIALDVAYRRRLGENPGAADYQARFPALGEVSLSLEEMETIPPSRGQPESSDSTWNTSCGVPTGTSADTSWPSIEGYDILGELGRGGMGVVYKAVDRRLKRAVALKMISPKVLPEAEEVARFVQEAEAASRLQHPNIVQIFEVGQQNGRPFFTMELVEGTSLAKAVNGRPIPCEEAAGVVEILARAIQVAHEHGIVHRDLKPANILVKGKGQRARGKGQERGELADDQHRGESDATAVLRSSLSLLPFSISPSDLKITDFGLAKRLDGGTSLTQSGVIMGTPSYMAPEQAGGKSKSVGPAADIYALGAILYELLTGRPPFQGSSPLDVLLWVISEEPIPPSRLRAKVPGELEAICLKCLEKDPGCRFGSALELAEELHAYLAGDTRTQRPQRMAHRSRLRLAGFGLLVASVVALFGLVWWGPISPVQLYSVCAVGGGTLVLCQFLLSLLGFGEHHEISGHGIHLAGDHAHVAEDHATGGRAAEASWYVGILSFRSVVVGLTVLGLTALAARQYGMGEAITLVIASAAGCAALLLVGFLTRALFRLDAEGTVRIEGAIGHIGSVYLGIPGNKAGCGKVTLNLQNRTVEYQAVTSDQALPTGTRVVVVAIMAPDTVEVARVMEG
jgi:serine/threonine protein kinase